MGSFVLDYHALYLQYFMSIGHEGHDRRVGPRILSIGRVDYFGTSDHFSGREKRTILMSKTSWFTGKSGSRIEESGIEQSGIEDPLKRT